ncbi:MAG: SDR family NAD(P)-dependent oxidoreductase [Nitrososphaeraceae archaeon]
MTDQHVAIITGGSSGIGTATAVALAKDRVKVTVAARRSTEGEETVQLVKEAGSEGIFVKTDVTKEDNVRLLVEETIKVYGRLETFFQNALDGGQLFRQYHHFNEDTFYEFLKEIHHKFPKCYLFLDKAPQHYRSSKVRKYFEEHRDNLIPVYLSSNSIARVYGTGRMLEYIQR